MSAYGAHILMKANKFSYLADLIGTISWKDLMVESPFNELIHFIRPQVKSQRLAVKEFLEGSEIIEQEKIRTRSVFIPLYPTSSWSFKDALTTSRKSLNGN
jgi:histidine ammonia-lyase